MVRHSPLQQLKEAKQIALDHGHLVTEKDGQFHVFRNGGDHLDHLGSRSTPTSLRAFVCEVTNFR